MRSLISCRWISLDEGFATISSSTFREITHSPLAGAFAIPATGTLGTSPRNFLIGPGSKNVDLSLFRTFLVRQRVGVQLRLEAFNAFDFVNFGNPRSNIGAANPGRIDTAGDARIMQVGFRMTF